MSSSGLNVQNLETKTAMTALVGGAAPTLAANTLAAINEITVVASDGNSVILPAGQAMGTVIYVANRQATAGDADVFPPTGGSINGGTTTTGQVRIPFTQGGIFVCASSDGLTWLALLTAVCTSA